MSVAVTTPVDATVSVQISDDKQQAYLTLTPPDGSQALALGQIIKAIMKAGVSIPLVNQEIVNTCFHQQFAKDVCFAHAKLPIKGNDADFIPLVESETILAPAADDHGVDDIIPTHQFLVVEVGTPLMRRVPATQGEAGVDVTGQVIKPEPGHDAGFATNLAGVKPSPENPNVLVAAIKGHPVMLGNGVNVDATLHLDHVNTHSGNIKFDGSVEVRGDVTAGMTIDVTGDVIVQGAVDRATIKAGHSIKLGGGLLGHEDCDRLENETVEYSIHAGSDVEAKFIQRATVSAGNNIVVKEYAAQSYLKSGNQVLLGQQGGKGIVLGGRCDAAHEIIVNQLGNESDVPTQITAGHVSELYKVYHNLEKDLAAQTHDAAQLKAILHKQPQTAPTLLGKLSLNKSQKIQDSILAIQKKVARTQTLLQALEPEIEQQKKAIIEVAKTIYPNVEMTINGITKRFSEKTPGDTWRQQGDTLVKQTAMS